MSEENIATTPETDNERDYREELLSIIRSSDTNEEIKEKLNRYEESSSLLLPVYNVYRLMSKTSVRTSD